jgi:transposase-like protein
MAKKGESKRKKRGGGRKSAWDEKEMPTKLEAVEGWARQGYIDAEIAKMLGISEATLYRWKNEHPEFKTALLKGKEISNGELVNAAFRVARGYHAPEQQAIKVLTWKEFGRADGSKFWKQVEDIQIVEVQRFIPANATMGIFMLKNRMPEHYRDKHEVKHEGQVEVTFVDDVPGDDVDG